MFHNKEFNIVIKECGYDVNKFNEMSEYEKQTVRVAWAIWKHRQLTIDYLKNRINETRKIFSSILDFDPSDI